MLYAIDSKQYIRDIPHRRFYDTCRARLTDAQYQSVFEALDRRVDSNEIHTSSWIPGANWMGTVYQPIYDTACHYDETAAAQFFGLILWHVMLERPEAWSFGRYEKNNLPIEGLTYFKLGVVP
jgi:hypothetical protein